MAQGNAGDALEEADTYRTILYALNRWEALARYCNSGRLEIDNTPVDRASRGAAVGRRNYLFAGADSGDERAAEMYSLVGTSKLNDVDPETYLRFVLARIAHHAIDRVDELIPWVVADQLHIGDRQSRCRRQDGTRDTLTARVIPDLDQIIGWRGRPMAIRCDNGREYFSEAITQWAMTHGIALNYIQPDSQQQNAYVRRFNRTVQHEWLSQYY
jgi:hypothetical protein